MIKNRRTAEHYKWGKACDGYRLLDRPDLTVIQECIAPGESEVKHFHRQSRQLFYVLDGQLRIELETEVLLLESGDSVEIVPDLPHRVSNVSPAPVTLLVISSPSTSHDREETEPLDGRRHPAL